MRNKQRKAAVRLLGEAVISVVRARSYCYDNPVIIKDLTDLQNGLREVMTTLQLIEVEK